MVDRITGCDGSYCVHRLLQDTCVWPAIKHNLLRHFPLRRSDFSLYSFLLHAFSSNIAPRQFCRIGVNITDFGRKLTLFSAIPLSPFSLKMSPFFAHFELEKNALYSASSGLGNQLSVLSKANSLCKIVKVCVLTVLPVC